MGMDAADMRRKMQARITELEDALKLIEEKAGAACRYFEGSGERLFINFATGTRDTARKALGKD